MENFDASTYHSVFPAPVAHVGGPVPITIAGESLRSDQSDGCNCCDDENRLYHLFCLLRVSDSFEGNVFGTLISVDRLLSNRVPRTLKTIWPSEFYMNIITL